ALPALIARQSIVELSGGSHEVCHGPLCGPNVCAHVMISFFMFVTVMIDGCIGRCGAHTSAFLTFHLPSISSHSAMNFSSPRTPRIAHTSASLTLSSRLDLRSWWENDASTSYPAFWAALQRDFAEVGNGPSQGRAGISSTRSGSGGDSSLSSTSPLTRCSGQGCRGRGASHSRRASKRISLLNRLAAHRARASSVIP